MTVKTIIIAKGKKCQLQTEILQPAKQRAILTTQHSSSMVRSVLLKEHFQTAHCGFI